jgi:hypothetical protein
MGERRVRVWSVESVESVWSVWSVWSVRPVANSAKRGQSPFRENCVRPSPLFEKLRTPIALGLTDPTDQTLPDPPDLPDQRYVAMRSDIACTTSPVSRGLASRVATSA